MKFQINVETGPLAARQALEKVIAALDPWSLDIEEKGTIELVLAEVLNNVVEHAYPEPNASGEIIVSGDAKSTGLFFKIEDFGHPMPDGQAPLGMQADLDVDVMDLPEGGFGWFLIRDLAKDVVYKREGDSNVLTLRLGISRET